MSMTFFSGLALFTCACLLPSRGPIIRAYVRAGVVAFFFLYIYASYLAANGEVLCMR